MGLPPGKGEVVTIILWFGHEVSPRLVQKMGVGKMNFKPLLLINNGLSIVSARMGDRLNGLVVHTAVQVHVGFPAVIVAIQKDHLTHDFVHSSGAFTLSILEKDTPMTLIELFGFQSGREVDKFAHVEYDTGKSGLPYVVDHALACLEMHVMHTFDVGTMAIFVGRIMNTITLKEGEPLSLYHYHFVKKGAVPKTSPLSFDDTLYFG